MFFKLAIIFYIEQRNNNRIEILKYFVAIWADILFINFLLSVWIKFVKNWMKRNYNSCHSFKLMSAVGKKSNNIPQYLMKILLQDNWFFIDIRYFVI